MSTSGGDLAKCLAVGVLVVASLLPVLLDDASSYGPYYAPLLPSLLVGYAFRSWASLAFALVPLALGVAFGHPAGFDPQTGTEWVLPEWFVYLFVTPFFVATIACGVGVGRWVAGRRRSSPPSPVRGRE
jgi:hypothetical protein